MLFRSKSYKNLQVCGRAHYCTTRKNLESRRQLDDPVECASGGDPLFHFKILNILFFPLVRILCALLLEGWKILSKWPWWRTFGISVSSAEGNSKISIFVSGSYGKHQVTFSAIILLKRNIVFIGHGDNILARRDSIFPLLRCQGVWNKRCTQLSLSQILF